MKLIKGFLVPFQATSAKDLFITKGWSSPFGFFRMPGDYVSRKGLENDIVRRFGYQGWVCHAGVINVTVLVFSFAILQSTLWSNGNWGNAYRIPRFHSCCIASVAKLCGFGFQEKYFSIWLDNMEVNRSITGITIFWQICWNTIGDNFHSEKSLLWWDCQSALVFRTPGRYSAVIVISFNSYQVFPDVLA